MATKIKPIAFKAINPIEEISIEAPPPTLAEAISALTTANIISPMTSSITAAPNIILASTVLSLLSSDNTLAVIPTLVAVNVAQIVSAVRKNLVSVSKLRKPRSFKRKTQ